MLRAILIVLSMAMIADASPAPASGLDTTAEFEISDRSRRSARRARTFSFGDWLASLQPRTVHSRATRHARRGRAARAMAQEGSCFGNRIVATWYKSGRRTASGERFNPMGLSAAHRTLPFGTRVRVTNPRNGASVSVVINDRGPFTRGVSLDLSLGAARAIGMHSTQTVCMS